VPVGAAEKRRSAAQLTTSHLQAILAIRFEVRRAIPAVALLQGPGQAADHPVSGERPERGKHRRDRGRAPLGIQRILATDTVRQIMRIDFSKDLLPAIHYSSYEACEIVCQRSGRRRSGDRRLPEQTTRVLVGVRAMVNGPFRRTSAWFGRRSYRARRTGLEPYEKDAYIVPLIISTLNRENYLDGSVREKEAQNRPASATGRTSTDTEDTGSHLEWRALRGAFVENIHLDQTVAQILTTSPTPCARSCRSALKN